MKIQTFGTKMSFLLLFGSILNPSNAQQTTINLSPKSQLLYSQPAQKGSKKLAITDCFSSQYSTAFGNPVFLKYPNEHFHLVQFIFNRDKKSHLYLYPVNQTITDSNGLIFIHADSFALCLKKSIQNFTEKKGLDSKDVKVMLNMIPNIHWHNSSSGWFEYNNYVIELNLNLRATQNDVKNSQLTPSQLGVPKSSVDLELSRNIEMNILYSTEENTTTSLTELIQNPQSTARTAYVKDYNLFIVGNSIQPTKITNDGKDGIIYGQSVHRNEFGINGGLFWSSDLNQLAFYRMDEQRVTKYPMFDIHPRPATPTEIRYPMSGDSSHTVTVGVYNLNTKSTVYLKTEGSYDHYLTNITWSPDSKSIYLFWVNRDQNRTELREYSSLDGKLIKTHIEYTHPKYTEPETGLIFSKNIPEGFIFQSEHSGFNHLYLYLKNPTNVPKNKKAYKNTQSFADGGVLNHYGYLFPITQGNWEVTEVLGLDQTENHLIYLSTRHSKETDQGALNRVPMISNIQTGETISILKNLTSQNTKIPQIEFLEDYIQSAIWIPATSRLLMITSNINNPRNLYSISTKDITSGGKISKKAVFAQLVHSGNNPISNFQIGEIKIESIENQGITLFQRTFLPPNFDPNKKYPVVVYLYGGPHAQMVTNSWMGGGNLWMAYMASEGYIVYTLDNRGSSHRGLSFENATHRNLGTIEMLDQLAGLDYLKNLPYVDSTRIGVHGWSFGGFMTTSLMTRYPGKYKVGVAGGPVIDWSFYEIMYTERYMDRPEENPSGYSQNNLLNYAQNLKGPLLMIHGADDDVVVWQHSLMFTDKCVKTMNTHLDYFVYPGHKHNVVGRDRAHLYKKISEYFFEKL